MILDTRYSNNINTITDICRRLEISRKTAQSLCRNGEIKAYKKLRKWYVLESDLIEWIKS